MKLNLGCGDRLIPGFVNVDCRSLPGVDVVAPAHCLPFPDDSASLVYASHVLEHYGRHEVPAVLTEWRRVLRHDGTLRIAVPWFERLVTVYDRYRSLDMILGPLCGRQDYPENTHRVVFDRDSLERALRAAGFRFIREWDWAHTEHAEIDDCSRSYIPHMDFENGLLISLNLQATK